MAMKFYDDYDNDKQLKIDFDKKHHKLIQLFDDNIIYNHWVNKMLIS